MKIGDGLRHEQINMYFCLQRNKRVTVVFCAGKNVVVLSCRASRALRRAMRRPTRSARAVSGFGFEILLTDTNDMYMCIASLHKAGKKSLV